MNKIFSKKIILITSFALLFFANNVFAWGDLGDVCLEATGFGSSEYNVEYDYAGTFNGATYYTDDGSHYIFHNYGSNASWAMNDVMDSTIAVSNPSAYYVAVTDDYPTDTWNIDAGTGPVGSVITVTCPGGGGGEGEVVVGGFATTTPGELQYVNVSLILIASILGFGLLRLLFI